MRTPFRISETAGRLALKFGMCLETHKPSVLQKLMVGYRYTCARTHPFPYLGNGETDCAEIWCGLGITTNRFTQDGGYLHERACS